MQVELGLQKLLLQDFQLALVKVGEALSGVLYFLDLVDFGIEAVVKDDVVFVWIGTVLLLIELDMEPKWLLHEEFDEYRLNVWPLRVGNVGGVLDGDVFL